MAPSIVWDRLPDNNPPLRILDPMAGSGTTLIVARSKGHMAYGVDRDPLAVMIAKASCIDIDKNKLLSKATEVLKKAKKTAKTLTSKTAYPNRADDETKDFIRYWFDLRNRKQLAALSRHISNVHNQNIKILLWTALSRMIITKKVGVSLAIDISHSRPHRVYDKAPVKPFDKFEMAVNMILKSAPFEKGKQSLPNAHVLNSDARAIPLADNSIDIVITSPPYLNAIDYLRGHKFSLVWMGHSIREVRYLRSTNIGAEVSSRCDSEKERYLKALVNVGRINELTERTKRILLKYAYDMIAVISEIKRVLKKNGQAVFVIGDSTIRGVFVKNSELIKHLAVEYSLSLQSATRRRLPEKHRYLPPPNHKKSGVELQRRMREEVILTFRN
jgi:DNA modification methylase